MLFATSWLGFRWLFVGTRAMCVAAAGAIPPFQQPERKARMTDQPTKHDALAVQKAIEASTRSGRRIGAKESRLIHALLKGRAKTTETKADD
jgi:hypothetical protein